MCWVSWVLKNLLAVLSALNFSWGWNADPSNISLHTGRSISAAIWMNIKSYMNIPFITQLLNCINCYIVYCENVWIDTSKSFHLVFYLIYRLIWHIHTVFALVCRQLVCVQYCFNQWGLAIHLWSSSFTHTVWLIWVYLSGRRVITGRMQGGDGAGRYY